MDEEKKSVRHRPGLGRESANSEGYDEFLSCDEYSGNEGENGKEEKKKMGLELDIAAINIDVREEKKEKPETSRAGTKVTIPKLNLPDAAGMTSRG